jgi:hypothetical protein
MLIQFFKGEPNLYAIRYRDGKVKQAGQGINFWYLPFNTNIAAVPTGNQDANFIFTEATANFQEVAIQGTLTFRFTNPQAVAQRLDYAIEERKGEYVYTTEDPEKLVQRVVNAVQTHTRAALNELTLEQALTAARQLEQTVLQAVAQEEELLDLGVTVINQHITAIKPTPEMQKALEASYREGLQKRADQAIYDRRAAAIEEERNIQEREIKTEIEIENRRKELVDTQARNNLTLAEADAKAAEMKLNPYAKMPPQALVGLALKEWAANAGQIGNLNITPDLLGQVVGWMNNDNVKLPQ